MFIELQPNTQGCGEVLAVTGSAPHPWTHYIHTTLGSCNHHTAALRNQHISVIFSSRRTCQNLSNAKVGCKQEYFLDVAELLHQKIICRRNPSHSSDHLLHLGPKRLVRKEQKSKTIVITCQGSTPTGI